MVGPPGSGKRTICYHASRKMGIDFVDVSLKQPKEVIADQLFGSAAAAERAQESGVPPGILGKVLQWLFTCRIFKTLICLLLIHSTEQ